MSSYLYFYIRSDDKFIPVGEYSRNHCIYQVMDTALFEKLVKVQRFDITSACKSITESVTSFKEQISNLREYNEEIAKMNGDVSERVALIKEHNAQRAGFEEQIDDLNYALGILGVYLSMLDDNVKLYMGIECYPPTVDDIKPD